MTCGKTAYEKVLFYLLWLLLMMSLGQTVFSLLYSGHIVYDDIEHLRAAYFVSLGDVPYRDFFEHHHPLLWYVLAPIVSLMPHDTVAALRIARFISFGVSLIGGYFVYKTEKRFIGGTLCALFCLVFYFWGINAISSAGLFHIKPDIYQRCCFFVGLYYLFCYFRYKKFRDLQICALLFAAAFLFLQTTLFYVAPLAIPVCYFLYQNPKKWLDFAKAAVLPLGILAVCAAALWKYDLLSRYIETNWLLNQIYGAIWLQTKVSFIKFTALGDMFIIAMAAICFLFYRQKINIYVLTLLSCLFFEFVFRTFFVTTLAYYLTWLAIYIAMLSAPLWVKVSLKYRSAFALFALVWAVHFYNNMFCLDQQKIHQVEKYIARTGGETIASQYFENHQSYYWMYPITESIDNMTFQTAFDYDLKTLYQKNMPQVILYPPLKQEDYYALRRILKPTPQQSIIFEHHYVDDFIRENYEEIEKDIYMRKDLLPTDEPAKDE